MQVASQFVVHASCVPVVHRQAGSLYHDAGIISFDNVPVIRILRFLAYDRWSLDEVSVLGSTFGPGLQLFGPDSMQDRLFLLVKQSSLRVG